MKKQYKYQVGEYSLTTRESAREIQRSYRFANQLREAVGAEVKPVPRIIQKLTVERVVR